MVYQLLNWVVNKNNQWPYDRIGYIKPDNFVDITVIYSTTPALYNDLRLAARST